MNKRTRKDLAVFARAQKPQYHLSQYTPHEQAIREHIRRGHKAGLERVEGLLSQENKF